MKIWKKNLNLEQLNQLNTGCAVEFLEITFTAIGDNWLEATMPINAKTKQLMGFLHGGISAALAETVGSMAGFCCVDENKAVVGIEITAAHLRPVKRGKVTARATPIRIGKTVQFWKIDVLDQVKRLCTSARLTLSVVNK